MKLIIGATGMLGCEICRILKKEGHEVRALVRDSSDPAKVETLKSMGVEIYKGDLRDTKQLKNAFKDITSVISTASSMPFSYIPGKNDIQIVDFKGMSNAIDLAAHAGVKQFIYTSFSGNLHLAEKFPLEAVKRKVEKYLMNSGMEYTILRPSYFMEVWLSAAVGFDVENSSIQIYGNGKEPVSYISVNDLSQIAVKSVDKAFARNSILELGGPEMLSQLDVVNVYEKAYNKKLEVQYVPEEALCEQMAQLEDPMQKSFTGLMLCLAKGDQIDMNDLKKEIQIDLTSVKKYAESLVPVT